MDSLLGQDLAQNLNNVQVKVVEGSTVREYKKKSSLIYIFLFAYLLIPVLSIEGITGWFLGISGAYKTINLFRGKEDNISMKATRLLMVYVVIAVIYNLLAYYVQKYGVAITV